MRMRETETETERQRQRETERDLLCWTTFIGDKLFGMDILIDVTRRQRCVVKCFTFSHIAVKNVSLQHQT